MLTFLHTHKKLQLLLGLLAGIIFGFLLQKSAVTSYDVILNQLLLKDFTVVKVMLSAVIVGMPGIHLMRSLGWINFHPKSGSVGSTVIGGLLFGAAFAILGYCPGTIVGAIAEGQLDALVGGFTGILVGSSIFANIYPQLRHTILQKGNFGDISLPEVFKVNAWVIVVPAAVGLTGLLYWLERSGL